MTRDTYSVLIIDMYHYQDEDENYEVDGFPTLELATEFARHWTPASVEHQRKPRKSREELRKMWHMFGEDAMVIGGGYTGSSELDFFVDHPATPDEVDWKAIEEQAGLTR